MIATHLPLVEKTCGLYLEELLPSAVARRLTQVQVVGLCTLYRRMGVAKLFTTGLPDELFADLSRSAHAFLYFLRGATDAAKLTSQSEPFLDAVACNDLATAKAIADCSRSTWSQGAEYQEDFLYAWFLMQRFALQAPAATLEPLLLRWEQILERNDDPRLELCRAFLVPDQRGFDDALLLMIETREREQRERLRAERLHPDDAPTLAKLWVELLALLRFAEQAGLQTEAHYPMAPAIARRLDRGTLPGPDAWMTVRTYREIS